MPGKTLRYFADSRIPYANAVAALAEHARRSTDEFVFGPADLATMLESGLAVSGEDLAGPERVLARVAGLVLTEPD